MIQFVKKKKNPFLEDVFENNFFRQLKKKQLFQTVYREVVVSGFCQSDLFKSFSKVLHGLFLNFKKYIVVLWWHTRYIYVMFLTEVILQQSIVSN